MNIRIITASAGSGKTYRLTEELDRAIATGRARPEAIVATTFTNQAAAELVERARTHLLQSGRARDAQQLLAARIGTVNAVSGQLVSDFAFELGLSPALRVLDEPAAELAFRRALARVVGPERAAELERSRFEDRFDWRFEIRRIIEAARANAITPDGIPASAERSVRELDTCLGPCDADTDLDGLLAAALAGFETAVDTGADTTKRTASYVALARRCRRDLARGRLRWGDWAKLVSQKTGKKSAPLAAPIAAVAARHIEHPRLRRDMHRLIELLFEVAADGLAAYQSYKQEHGVIDFIDQETLALRLLRRDDIRAELAGQFDLVLVDEFQDTSPIQLAIFLELAAIARESIWVGDPKQAIFGFRGTDPALMDAAIESRTSTRTDPDLVSDAARAVGAGRTETLAISYRSRPELVAVTSEVFARAFAHQGMPEERTRLQPHLNSDPPGLGAAFEYWPLASGKNAELRAAAVASGVKRLLGRGERVRDRHTGEPRPTTRADVAVLCRTNAECQQVAEALGALGIAAVVPRMGLLDTAEGQLALAGLRLWVDRGDALAAAEIARMVTYADDVEGMLARVLEAPGREAFAEDPTVAAITGARAQHPDAGALAAFDHVVAASALRRHCAGWGDAGQRLANLDALRSHAVAYVDKATAQGDAVSVIGLLRHFDELVDDFGWGKRRADSQALLSDEDAVTISTRHRAKGLEWPITVLFGLESLHVPRAHGVHVMSDRTDFDVADPLGGRWIRLWPNPYNAANQRGAVQAAFERSPAHATLVGRADRESLRVLYVGWTRARDRLVLAARPGKLLIGLVGKLAQIDPGLVCEPNGSGPGIETVSWAEREVDVAVAPCAPEQPVATPPVAGEVTVGRAPAPRAPARMTPSSAAPVPGSIGEMVTLGERIPLRGPADMAPVGDAVHRFLAADRAGLADAERLALAAGLLDRFGVAAHLDPADVAAAATRLWRWIEARFEEPRLLREWPLCERRRSGTVVAGAADLVVHTRAGVAVIDHKTFPGIGDAAMTEAAARARALSYSGQLAAYASALAAATAAPVLSTWIHFPVLGRLVEVRAGTAP